GAATAQSSCMRADRSRYVGSVVAVVGSIIIADTLDVVTANVASATTDTNKRVLMVHPPCSTRSGVMSRACAAISARAPRETRVRSTCCRSIRGTWKYVIGGRLMGLGDYD